MRYQKIVKELEEAYNNGELNETWLEYYLKWPDKAAGWLKDRVTNKV